VTTSDNEAWPEHVCIGPAIEYPTGAVLFHQGDDVRALFLIDAGVVKLTRCEAGAREVIAGLRTRPWLLGAASAVLGRPYPATARTLNACALRRLPPADFLRLQRTDLSVACWVEGMLARESDEQLATVGMFGAMAPRQRLEQLLSNLLRLGCVARQDGALRLALPLKRHELAEMIGTTPEHLSRLLAQLEGDGLILRDKGGWLWCPKRSRLVRGLDSNQDHG
jgi:CRP/FNR family transcriptional regulator